MEYRAGDKIVFTVINSDYEITKNTVYELYEDEDGWLCFTDDDGDEVFFTNGLGETREWLDECSFHLVVDEVDSVLIDAEELLRVISHDTTIREAIAYIQGYIARAKR